MEVFKMVAIILFLMIVGYYPAKDFFEEKRKQKNMAVCFQSQMYAETAKELGWYRKQILCLEDYHRGARFAE